MAVMDVRARMTPGQPTRARTALASWRRQGTQMVSAARHRLRRPALTISGLGCVDTAAFHTSTGLGWLVTGISVLVLEMLGGDE